MATATRTGGRTATTGVIPGRYSIAVGDPGSPTPDGWRWTALTDVARLESGHTPSRREAGYWDGGDIPWIGIRDATGNHGAVLADTEQHVTQLGIDNSSARVLPAGTVCLSRTASVGYVVAMGRPMATSQDFVNWVCGDRLDATFLRYALLAEHETYLSFASGTTHQTIYFPEVKAFYVKLPPLEIQQGIATLLRAFDDLIDNNRRRIEILEEMARLLYREWFVYFRFPGHEDVDLVDSELGPIPAGWTISRLTDVAEVNASSVRKGDDLREILYLDISSVGPRTMASPDPMLFSEAPGRARRRVQHGDVIWSTVRPNRRSHVMIQDPAMNLICSTGFAVLSANSVPPSYLLELCSTDDFVSHLESLATGAAYPAVRPADFEVYRFVKPPNHLLQCWDEQARPMNDLVGNLTRQNAVLRQARDVLLPRLVSGELDVSELDLGGLVA